MKEQSKKVGLEHNIHKTKIIASSPITFWQIDGESMETVTEFIFCIWVYTVCIYIYIFYIYAVYGFCLFNLCAEYIMRNAGLHEEQAGIKTTRKNIHNLRYADDTTLMAESEEELKSLLIKVKEECEKADLKLNIQKTKIMTSSPITSWQIDGESMETVTNFIFLGYKITADGDCSHKVKRLLLLGREAMTILDSILKLRDITLVRSI